MKHLDIFKPNHGNGPIAIANKVSSFITSERKIIFQCEAIPLNPDDWHEKIAWWTDSEIEILGNVIDEIVKYAIVEHASNK